MSLARPTEFQASPRGIPTTTMRLKGSSSATVALHHLGSCSSRESEKKADKSSDGEEAKEAEKEVGYSICEDSPFASRGQGHQG